MVYPLRQAILYIIGKLYIFFILNLRSEYLTYLGDLLPQIKVLFLDLELTGLYLRIVKDVINLEHEESGGRVDYIQIFSDQGVADHLEYDMEHAQDMVDWSTELMGEGTYHNRFQYLSHFLLP